MVLICLSGFRIILICGLFFIFQLFNPIKFVWKVVVDIYFLVTAQTNDIISRV